MWVAPSTMMLCTLLGYIDRQVLAALSPTILAETGMTAADYGWAVSAFSVTYMIMNPVFGSFLDYIGLRRGMAIAVLIWTVASVSHAGLNGLIGFALARALLGFGEGAAFPGALRTAAEALPVNRQSRGMALGYSGASLGALITPPIIIPLAGAIRMEICISTHRFPGCAVADSVVARRPPAVPARTQQKTAAL